MPVGYQGHFRYALRVVITIKSMPWTKKVYLYNQKRYFYPIWGFGLILANFGLIWPLMWPKFDLNLTQIWPKFDPNLSSLLSKLAVFAQSGLTLAQIWPNLIYLTYFVTDAGSSNWIYALTLVIILRNVKFWVSTFKIGCFGTIWPKFDPNVTQFGPFKSL